MSRYYEVTIGFTTDMDIPELINFLINTKTNIIETHNIIKVEYK